MYRFRMTIAVLRTTITLVALAALAGCGSRSGSDAPAASIPPNGDSTGQNSTSASPDRVDPVRLTANEASTPSPARAQVDLHPEVVITTTLGEIRVRLDAEKAPQTVANFLENYVDRGFYDQTIFHYVEPGFMIAGGGYAADLQPKETRTPIINEADNGLHNQRGALAMAHHPDYFQSATSQFFINLADNTSLDYVEKPDGSQHGYCVFGQVVAGMDVVDKIAAAEVHDVGDFTKTPVKPVLIEAIQRAK